MARVSIYDSQLSVPVLEAPRLQRTDVSSGLMSVADTVGKIEDDMHRAHQATMLTDAQVNAAKGWRKIDDEGRRLPWDQKQAHFQENAARLRSETLDAISDPEVKRSFTMEFERSFGSYEAHTSADAFKGEAAHNLAKADEAGDAYARQAALARTPAELQLARDGQRAIYGNLRAGGFIDEFQERTAFMKWLSDSDMFAGREMIANNPHAAKKLFSDTAAAADRFPGLGPNQIEAMQQEAERDIKGLEGEARATAAMARQEAQFDIDQWRQDNEASLAATGKSVPAPHTDEELKTLLTPGKYEAVKRGEQQAAALFAATGDLASLTISEQNTSLAKTAPVEGQEGFAAQQAIHFAGLARQKQVLTERRENPGAAVLSSFPKVAAAWSAYEASQKPEDLRAALKQSQMAQEALGIPRIDQVLMPNQMIWSIARGVKGASPENAAKQMRGLAESLGPFWPRIFQNMSKNLTGHLNVSAVIKDSVAAAMLVEGSRQSIADLRKAAGVADNNDGIVKAAADDERVKDFATSLSQRAGGSATATQVVKSIEVLALQRMRVHSEDQADATEGAIKEIVDKNYAFTGEVRTFRVPLEAGDAATIGEGARGYQARLKVDNLDLPDEINGTGEKWTKEEYIASIYSKGYWVTNDDESGAILYFERGVPVTEKGKELSLTWKELLDAEQDTVYRRDSEKFRRGRQDGVTPTVRAKPDGTGGPAAPMPGPAAAAPQGTPRAISAADLASTTDADLLAQTAQPVKEPQISAADTSRQLVELGKRGPASVPAWLEDIEAARKKGNKEQRAAAQKFSVEIAALKAEIQAASAEEKAKLKDSKTWKLARSLGVLN